MPKVTSKLQLTVPKAVADQYGIRPGDELEWIPAGDVIRVVPPGRPVAADDTRSRLRQFDQASRRQRGRQSRLSQPRSAEGRGWTREELYGRGRAR